MPEKERATFYNQKWSEYVESCDFFHPEVFVHEINSARGRILNRDFWIKSFPNETDIEQASIEREQMVADIKTLFAETQVRQPYEEWLNNAGVIESWREFCQTYNF